MSGKTNSRKTSSYYNSVYNTIPKNPKRRAASSRSPFVFVTSMRRLHCWVFLRRYFVLLLRYRGSKIAPIPLTPPNAPPTPLRCYRSLRSSVRRFLPLCGNGGAHPFWTFVASVAGIAGVAGVADVADVADVDCFSRKIRRSLRSRIPTRVALF